MKILNILQIVLTLSLTSYLYADVISESISTSDNNATQASQTADINATQLQKKFESKTLSEFEKLFINHVAFNYYKSGITALYQGDYKAAYENAMKAQEIVDNTDLNTTTIALPFMPSYIRETSYSPKRTYYKIVKQKEYKLKRLITKAKLISPPIASMVIHRTSTTIDIILRNHGDLPFDDFEVFVNEKPIALYEKLLPNEEKTIKIQKAPKLYEVSFKEKYGFAPKSFMLSEEY